MGWCGSGRQRLGLVAMTEHVLDYLRGDLALRLDGGGEMSAGLQAQVIDVTSRLSDDELATLRLFAWAYRPNRRGPRRAPDSVP